MNRKKLCFGEFELDQRAASLCWRGDAVSIARKPLELLTYLIEHRDRVVTRSELISVFWSNSPHGANDRMNSCVRRVRAALGETKASARFIETRSRIGYRFVGTIHVPPPTFKFVPPVNLIARSMAAIAAIACAVAIFPLTANWSDNDHRKYVSMTMTPSPEDFVGTQRPRFDASLERNLFEALERRMPPEKGLLRSFADHDRPPDYTVELMVEHSTEFVRVRVLVHSSFEQRVVWAGEFEEYAPDSRSSAERAAFADRMALAMVTYTEPKLHERGAEFF